MSSEGLLAEFEGEEELAHAAHQMRALGYRNIEAFMPYPSEEVMEALDVPRSRLPILVLFGAVLGGSLAYLTLWWTNIIDYPLDVGGRAPHPWPAFIPITFEVSVLFGGAAAFLGFFLLCGLPRLWHPLFEMPGFGRVTSDGFFLVISADDPRFEAGRTTRDLEDHGSPRIVSFTSEGAPR